MINFIAATMGSGNIALAYVIMKNGYIGGSILILIGGLLSYYTGLLLTICGSYTNKNKYEEIAYAIYGSRMAKITSVLMLAA